MLCHAPAASSWRSNLLLMVHIVGEGGSGSICEFTISHLCLSSLSGDWEAAGGREWDDDESSRPGEAAPPQRQGAANHTGELAAVDVAEEGVASPHCVCSRDCFQMHAEKLPRCKWGHQETGCFFCMKRYDFVLVTPLWWPLRRPTSQPAPRLPPCGESSRRRTPPSRGTSTLRGGCWSWNSKAPSVCTRSLTGTFPLSRASAAVVAAA